MAQDIQPMRHDQTYLRSCIREYVIEQLATGDPIVQMIFETVAQGGWITRQTYEKTIDIILKHYEKHGSW